MAEDQKNRPISDSYIIDVYLHAAEQEQRICEEIKKFLKPVIRNANKPIVLHSDFDIPVGQEVEKYKDKIYTSEIVLAFISSDYLFDDECHARRKKVIERYNQGKTILLPILVRNCMWKSSPFAELPVVPGNLQPVNNKQYWNSEDDALTEVANEIYKAIESFSLDSNAKQPGLPSFDEMNVQVQIETFHTDNSSKSLQVPETEISSNWRQAYFRKVAWIRTQAFLLDIIITSIPALLPFILFFRKTMESGMELQKSDYHAGRFTVDAEFIYNNIIWYIIPLGIYLMICAAFESSKFRGTFGKMILKLQTTDQDGNRISFFKALWRNILKLLIGGFWIFVPLDLYYFGESTNFYIPVSLTLLGMILQIWYFKKSRKLIHDDISKTDVGEMSSRKK
ncbi:MAG: RDD family protein [Bacteroidia bacterium]|nr:RDD family protein [Bacteroidia bacterium]